MLPGCARLAHGILIPSGLPWHRRAPILKVPLLFLSICLSYPSVHLGESGPGAMAILASLSREPTILIACLHVHNCSCLHSNRERIRACMALSGAHVVQMLVHLPIACKHEFVLDSSADHLESTHHKYPDSSIHLLLPDVVLLGGHHRG